MASLNQWREDDKKGLAFSQWSAKPRVWKKLHEFLVAFHEWKMENFTHLAAITFLAKKNINLLIYSRVDSPQWTTVNEKERTLRSKTQKKKSEMFSQAKPRWNLLRHCVKFSHAQPTLVRPFCSVANFTIYIAKMYKISYVNLMEKSNSHFLMVLARFWDKNQFRSRRTESLLKSFF